MVPVKPEGPVPNRRKASGCGRTYEAEVASGFEGR
jgi:hypothetical protein